MGNGDGRACCILGICCAPGSDEQRAALVEVLTKHYKDDLTDAQVTAAAADILAQHADFNDIGALVDRVKARGE